MIEKRLGIDEENYSLWKRINDFEENNLNFFEWYYSGSEALIGLKGVMEIYTLEFADIETMNLFLLMFDKKDILLWE